ncbi:hypothetical protein MMC30_004168 [Trapelia coarctata]|nr:hypothetical protein [Trapelia coarctata]
MACEMSCLDCVAIKKRLPENPLETISSEILSGLDIITFATGTPPFTETIAISQASLPPGIIPVDIISAGCSGVIALCPRTTRILKFSHESRRHDKCKGLLQREHEIYAIFEQKKPKFRCRILQCYGFALADVASKPDYLLLEYASNGSVRQFLRMHDETSLPLAKRVRWTVQVAEAVSFCHSVGVLHGDINCSNIFLTDTLDIMLADFGNVVTETLPRLEYGGTYSCTHRLPGREENSIDTDIFALGSTMFEIMTGKQPYEHLLKTDHSHRPHIERLYSEGTFPETAFLGDFGAIILGCWMCRFQNVDGVRKLVEKHYPDTVKEEAIPCTFKQVRHML